MYKRQELDKSKISFHISIDGLESKHDAFRKTPGAFKNAINAMNLLNNVGLTACCNFMLTSQSIAEFDNLEKIINKAGCKSINIGQCAPVGRNDIDISYDEWSKFFRTTTDKQKGKKYNCSTRCMTHEMCIRDSLHSVRSTYVFFLLLSKKNIYPYNHEMNKYFT